MRGMTPEDEAELQRLCDLLATVARSLPLASPSREALQKAALGLQAAYLKGFRPEIESSYAGIGASLTPEQRAFLDRIGLAD